MSVQWLHDVDTGPWAALGGALRGGLAVPNGFIADSNTPEEDIRNAYEDLKRRERTHFVALRGPSHALLDVLGNDMVIHSLRRLWAESPMGAVLIQRMIHSEWNGKASATGRNSLIRIKANEGLLLLDPDAYLFNRATNKCTRRTLQKSQRQMIRWLDGTSRTVVRDDRQTPLTAEQLQAIAELASSAQGDITWALDDRRVWLLGITQS